MAITKIELGSLAEQLLQFGDIITKNDNKKIKSQKQFEEFLTKIGKNDYVFVTCVVEHTLAGLSLTVGEAKILNVNSVPVTTVTDVLNAIHAALRKNGCVIIPFFNRTSSFCKQITLIIEQANHTLAAAYVRHALMVEKLVEMDLSFAPDVIDICKQECKRMKRNPDLKSNQNILKYQDEKPRLINSRIQINEKTGEMPIAHEDIPALLMKVSI
ncbi:unnamed protein product, partial [Onchocerca ochengi]|uniref:PDZ_3 domain-containing protein n=1 Tax=Onchocerca ochengi TaxID=42157 RepID=A0A182E8P9_ONCOC